jgi:hypothetical protein
MALLIEVLLGEPTKGGKLLSPPVPKGAAARSVWKIAHSRSEVGCDPDRGFSQIAMTSAGRSLENPTTTVLENRGGNRCVSRPANAVLA